MGKVMIFVQRGCFKCPPAKEVGGILEKEGVEVLYYDIDTVDGLTEASYYGVLATPTIIVEGSNETMLADYRGSVPTVQQVKELLVK